MAEGQVAPASVNIDLLAQVPHGHGRALDVPTRPAGTKGRRPRRLVGRRAAPQRKVQGIPFAIGPDRSDQTLFAELAQHRSPAAMRKTAVAPITADGKVERVGPIGVARGAKT